MIYKHQRIVFWVMVGCIVLMATLLFLERQRGASAFCHSPTRCRWTLPPRVQSR